MPSLTKFCVEFDRLDVTYVPGETVTGNIVVEISEAMKIRANTQIEIPPGHHRYPFTFTLPRDIPNSFQHYYGYVTYTVMGVINRPSKFDQKCETAFIVRSGLDLNKEECLGVDEEITNNFCCLCFISLGSLNMRIRIPTLGYTSGQRVSATIDYVNSSSSVRVTKIEMILEQMLSFQVESFNSSVRTDRNTVASSKMNVPVATKAQIISELLLPSIIPSYLPFCRFINVVYELNIIVHVSGMHFAVRKTYLPIIGTVPLNCSASAPLLDELKEVPKSGEVVEKSSEVRIPLLMPILPNVLNQADDRPSCSDIHGAPKSDFTCSNQTETLTIDNGDKNSYGTFS
ncbi:arrestin domain-containing protein 17-like [Calliopsis andreniformis]|uniref:arrestin domain-containing protein 17-like n=1 Tax=Calliopsis andreniformis TaxID=337506 RepID=UPI003FCECC41